MSARPAAMILCPFTDISALLGAERYEPWWLRASRRPGRLRAPRLNSRASSMIAPSPRIQSAAAQAMRTQECAP